MPKKIQARKSPIHGNGVFAVAPIKKGELVIEYKGKRRTHAEVDADDSGDVERLVNHALLLGMFSDVEIFRCRKTVASAPKYAAWLKEANGLRERCGDQD